jgi:formylmethanofuran dehydrogenase subunit D
MLVDMRVDPQESMIRHKFAHRIRFAADRSGSVIIIFALLAPVLLGVVGIAVDYATWALQLATLQRVADSAALAVASDLQVSGANTQRMQSLADSFVASTVKLQRGDGTVTVLAVAVARERPGGPFVPAGTPGGRAPSGVKVTLTQRKHAIMSRLVTPHLTDITVSAVAEAVGSAKLCIVGLAPTGASVVRLENSATSDAGDCAVYSMSAHAKGMEGDDRSLIASAMTCTVGGYKGRPDNFKPIPVTGCPAIKDPLADRPPPPVEGCSATDLYLRKGAHTLTPGTYCGGLKVDQGAEVTLKPGIYVMKDGPLVVGPSQEMVVVEMNCDQNVFAANSPQCAAVTRIETVGSLKGDGVGIYFTGDVSRSKFGTARPLLLLPHSVVELTAPRTGPMAGLLLFEDRDSASGRKFDILSDTARRLVGTIYLPRGTFSVRANQVVADQSEYTAIVANQIYLARKPRLVINTRYGATDVPVPKGLGPKSGTIGLAN